ncbi:MAG: sulfatase-like hydrolase/transferase [Clostridia bacterium]|nr:sulfatase-like hydrolase/transferase [Clostridia bacterium]
MNEKVKLGNVIVTKLIMVKRFLKKNLCYIFAILAMLLPVLLVYQYDLFSVFGERKGLVAVASFGMFTAFWIIFFMVASFVILPDKMGRIFYTIITTLFIIISFCQYVYFQIFSKFFWFKSIVLADEGANYLDIVFSHIDFKLISFTIISIVCFIIAVIKWKPIKISISSKLVFLLLPIVGIFSVRAVLLSDYFCESKMEHFSWLEPGVIYNNFTDVNKTFYVCGLYQTTFRDVYAIVFDSEKEKKDFDYEKVNTYFSKKGQTHTNTYTDIFKGKNVIAIMLESIDTWMVDEKSTPTICYMMKNGINFTNYYSPTFGTGHTFNSEFAFNTGYFNPPSSITAVNFQENTYKYSIANLFKNEGYCVNSWHFNSPEFYNRNIMHKQFGFEKYNSFAELSTSEKKVVADSNVLKNEEIYQKMIEKQPFFNFIITYSGHIPYVGESVKLSVAKSNHPELIDTSMDKETNNCQLLAADTDDFLKQLLEKLEKDNLLNDTVIVAYTDHYTYSFSDQEKLKEYKGDDLVYRVPAFIYSKGIQCKQIDKPVMTIDLLPTLINMFGLSREGKYIGNDIMAPENSGFVYFEDGSWIDNSMYYIPNGAELNYEKDIYIKQQNKRVKESMEITEIVVSGDFFAN